MLFFSTTAAFFLVFTSISRRIINCQKLPSFRATHSPLYKNVYLPGDVILGGFFPVHQPPLLDSVTTTECGSIKKERGIQRLEAMLFALDVVNSKKNKLMSTLLGESNIKFGALIYDSCDYESYAVERAMNILLPNINYCPKIENVDKQNAPVVGVIGSASSVVSMAIADILRLAEIPQISYASTSSELSQKPRFQYFSRVVPPDTYQAEAVVGIIQFLNWTYVAVIKETGSYGERLTDDFKAKLKNKTVCIAGELSVNLKDMDSYARVLKDLHSDEKYKNVKGVVLFAQEDSVRQLLNQTSSHKESKRRFIWIGTDGWGSKTYPVENFGKAAINAFTIAPKLFPIKEFDTYFNLLRPSTNVRNPFFIEYWEQTFKCKFNNTPITIFNENFTRICTDEDSSDPLTSVPYSQEGYVHYVVDAVFALVIAVQKFIIEKCKTKSLCDNFFPVNGTRLLSILRNISYKNDLSQRNIRFTAEGDGIGTYDIFQYQVIDNTGKLGYITIGDFSDNDGTGEHVHIDLQKLKWFNSTEFGVWKITTISPRSYCTEPCRFGEIRTASDSQQCCWTCRKCDVFQIAINETICSSCLKDEMPNANLTKCIKIEEEYLSIKNVIAWPAIILSSIGLIMTLYTIIIFVRFGRTPIIKASGRELCYLLLAGICFCHLCAWPLILKPHIITCFLIRISVSLSLTICLAALLTKTNRLARIFNSTASRSLKQPSCLSPRSQIGLCSGIVSVQLIGVILWIIIAPPSVKQKSEVKHSQRRLIQLVCLAICLSLSATVILICLFAPKLYIVLFNPSKNINYKFKTTLGTSTTTSETNNSIANKEHRSPLQRISNMLNDREKQNSPRSRVPSIDYTEVTMYSKSDSAGLGDEIQMLNGACTDAERRIVPTCYSVPQPQTNSEELAELIPKFVENPWKKIGNVRIKLDSPLQEEYIHAEHVTAHYALSILTMSNSAELSAETATVATAHTTHIPVHRQARWGYKDSKFVLNSNGLIEFSGSRYLLSGHVLPRLKEFMFSKLGATTDIYTPSVAEPDPLYRPKPVINESFMQQYLTQLSTMEYSSEVNDRLFHAHGHTLEEIWKLRHGGQFERIPDLVVWPCTHQDIEKLVVLACEHDICLIPFGGGTSVTWALLCPTNEQRMIVSVDTSQMNKILHIDEKNLTARIQAGIIGQDLERELSKKGYCTGHEPDSMEFSSLGGWVATRASGMKKNVYGNIEDLLVHVKIVTPKGTMEKSCLGPRQSTGLDIHHFILGSEGILGIITEVVLKIRPLPQCKKYGSIVFPDFESGVECLREIARLRCAPASIRLLDNEQFVFGQALATDSKGIIHSLMDNIKKLYITKIKGFDVNRMCAATLLFEGLKNDVNQREKFVYDIAQKYNGIPAGEENGLKGYTLTFMIAYLRDIGLDHKVVAESFETSVPWDRVIDLCRNVKRCIVNECLKYGVKYPPFASCRVTQMYDAGCCVYFYFVMNYNNLSADPIDVYEKIEEAARNEVLANGGSLSHHHGIGKIRTKWIRQAVGDLGVGAMLSVKQYLDPKNIFGNKNLIPGDKIAHFQSKL
ncbi:unnamed protein product [Didymodactylos carnosus]|uniref:alkylglycerone-phosphate synthase n=1 Tax=Didymodactylos carnosus TaxID=1234261 RepID=A0A8S2GJW6_9BILA|nr:unnamed protein product [Didymodactylos carnosus]CAF3529168.1 unnamed protein product [Didymodactylos carnosus]